MPKEIYITSSEGNAVDIIDDSGIKELRMHDKSGQDILNSILSQLGGTAVTTTILKQAEYTMVSRSETDVTSVTYTVPVDKTFRLVFFGASVDSPANAIARLKVDNVTKFRFDIGGGQGMKVNDFTFPNGIQVATAGQVVKITIEPQYGKGTIWAGFAGLEV